jgi:hypothetical protein
MPGCPDGGMGGGGLNMADVDRIASVGSPPERLAERRPPRKRRKGEPGAREEPPAAEPAAEEPAEADRGQSGQKHLDICV